MSKKFTFKSEDVQGSATLIFDGDSLEQVVEQFEKFLRATGFDLGDMEFALINLKEAYDDIEFEDEDEGGSGEGQGNSH